MCLKSQSVKSRHNLQWYGPTFPAVWIGHRLTLPALVCDHVTYGTQYIQYVPACDSGTGREQALRAYLFRVILPLEDSQNVTCPFPFRPKPILLPYYPPYHTLPRTSAGRWLSISFVVPSKLRRSTGADHTNIDWTHLALHALIDKLYLSTITQQRCPSTWQVWWRYILMLPILCPDVCIP